MGSNVSVCPSMHGHHDTGNIALPRMDERIALRIGEAAAAIGVCRATFWRLMHTGEIPVVHLGGCRRILRRDLERWLEAHKEGGVEA